MTVPHLPRGNTMRFIHLIQLRQFEEKSAGNVELETALII